MVVATLTTAVTAVQGAIDLAKGVHSVSALIDRSELALRLAELASALDVARGALDGQRQIEDGLKGRIQELEEALAIQGDVVRDGDAMYLKGAEGYAAGEPYCLSCWTAGKGLKPLIRPSGSASEKVCPACGQQFAYHRTMFAG